MFCDPDVLFDKTFFFQRKQHRQCISKTTPRKRLSSSLIPGPSQRGQEVVYLREILQGFGAEQASSTRIFEDNQACITMSENTVHRDTNVLAAHWCTQILGAGARRRQARQAHAVCYQRDGSRCTDEKLPYPPFRTHRNTMHSGAQAS